MGPSFCPAQPHTPGALGSWSQSRMGPALLCSALLLPRSPSGTQTPPNTPSAPQEEHKQFRGNSWVDQLCRRKKAANSPLENSQPFWERVMGSTGPHQVWALPPIWAPRSRDKVSALVLSPQAKQGGQTQSPDSRGCLLSAKGES